MTDNQTSVGEEPTPADAAVDSEARDPDADFDDYASYEDDGALVICDRFNPSGWIRSEDVTELQP